MEKICWIGILLVCCSACDMDMMFLHPEPLPDDIERQTILHPESGEQRTVHFSTNDQIVFTDKEQDTLDLPYEVDPVWFDSENDSKLYGWMIAPEHQYNESTILFLHGNAGNILSHFTRTTPLVNKGYRVFLFDYSGFGFSEGAASRAQVLEDAQAALEYISERMEHESEQLLIYGQSLGGHLAMTVAARKQEWIDGLIVEGAYSSADDIASSAAGWLGRILVNEQYSGMKAIEKYHKPLLVIHSREDKTVPFEHGRKIYQAANEPKYFLKIDRCHICGPLYYPDRIARQIEEMKSY